MIRILVVEDSPTQAEQLRFYLQDDFDVRVALDGQQALDLFHITDFDLVLTDVVMPGLSGYELCRTIKDAPAHRRVPVILLTQLNDPAAIVKGIECRADAFIPKPYKPDDLIGRIRSLLANHALRETKPPTAGVEVVFLGTKFTITSEKEEIIDLLLSTCEEVIRTNQELQARQAELRVAKARVEARAEEATARLAAIVEFSADAIIGLTLEGAILTWNAGAEKLFGYAAEEVLGKPVVLLVPPDWPDDMSEMLGRVRRGEQIHHYETVRLRKNGTRVDISLSVSPVKDAEGRVVGASKIARAITTEKASQEALRLRDRAIQAVNQGILITDANQPDNPIIYASPGFERLTGYAQAEVVGRNCRFLQGNNTYLEEVARLRKAIRGGQASTVELLNYRKDGTPFWNELSISPIWDQDGVLSHFVGVQTDVTQRRLLEEQYRQAQKMEAVGRLAGGIAHDFNNLLTVILGFGDMATHSLPPGNPTRDLIGPIANAGERAASLTRQLLAFSRQQVLAPKVLDLNGVVADLEKMLRRVIGEDVILAASLQPDLGLVKADPGQIEQVLMNLVVNARDAIPHGGRVTIETRNVALNEAYAHSHPEIRPGAYVLLAVSDTGHGMTGEVKARLFEPFFTTKEKGRGTGLGLATVFGIVKQSGGGIEVFSEVGAGSTFKVYLPRVEEAVASGKSKVSVLPIPQGNETVLVCEDEESVRGLICRVLEDCGYRLLEAKDGDEAVAVAGRYPEPIDLLLTDIVMPVVGGRQLATWLLALRPGMKVLYMSGYTDDAVFRDGVLHEKVNFLPKPFSVAALAQKVREVLDAVTANS